MSVTYYIALPFVDSTKVRPGEAQERPNEGAMLGAFKQASFSNQASKRF